MANALMSKILKTVGKNSRATVLSSSDFLDKGLVFSSRVPLINLMISGSFDGGVYPGIHQVVGESRTFKTNFCLSLVKDFLDSDPEAVVLFFDTEFGAAKYFDAFGIDKDRVIHIPCENLEEMKFQLTQMIEELTPSDKVLVFIDSISQVASKKEVENALEENAAADLTRAREMNSFFRIITPKLQIRKIPLFAINSFYESISNKYAEPTIKGGKQNFLSSDVILFVTRSQIKDEEDEKQLAGWSFNYSTMKSRWVKEKSKFSLVVTYAGGIDKNTGLFELAQDAGYIRSEKKGWYQIYLPNLDSNKSWRRKELEAYEPFFDELLNSKDFKEYCRKRYALEAGEFFSEDDLTSIDSDGVVTKE